MDDSFLTSELRKGKDVKEQDFPSLKCQNSKPRIEFPNFSGNGNDVIDWLENCEYYFDLCQTPEMYKTRLAVIHMIGDAREWFRYFEIDSPHPSWPILAEEIIDHFKGDNSKNSIVEFKLIHQTGKVSEYIQRHVKARADSLPEPD